jgi:hypothetical protein
MVILRERIPKSHAMITCPYCQQPAAPSDPQCRSCGFTAPAADQVYGSPPVLGPGINDLAMLLKPTAQKRISLEIANLTKTFPQIALSVITTEMPPGAALRPFLCWVMNRSTICHPLHRGSTNRTLLFGIDSASRQCALTIGYGLEPFLSEHLLDQILTEARELALQGQFDQAVCATIQNAHAMLEHVWTALPVQYGIDMEAVQVEEAARLGLSREVAATAPSSSGGLLEY